MILIHWTTAALLLAALALAWLVPDGPGQGDSLLVLLHKSVGLTVLALAALRVLVRNAARLPREDSGIARVEALAARVVHWLLYVILLAMPISGYLSESALGHTVSVFGLFDIPALTARSGTLNSVTWTIHKTGQLAIYVVVGVHVLAALFHLVVRRDGVMARMLPGVSLEPAGARAHPVAE
jgi:cytochrome b561